MSLVGKKYWLLALFFLISSVASAQIMLPAYQGVFAKQSVVSGGLTNALNFDGVNDYVDCGTNPKLNITSSLTVELWIKPNRNMGEFGWDRLVHRDWQTGYFFGGKNGSTNALVVVLSGDLNAAITPNNTVVVGVWQHVAFVFDDPANTISIYKDGTLISTSNWAGSISGNPTNQLTLNQNAESFMGSMDDVRIWSVARTQSQIQANMNNELNGTETGLVAYYPFNQGIAGGDNTAISTVTDKTANAINGTLTNFSKNGLSSNFVSGKLVSPNAIISNGLVMHLDAGNTASYPGSGTTWTDLSGNGYNGTLVNGPTYSSSNGGSIVFDGSNDVASFGNILNMGLNSWTLSCWVKFNSGSVPSSGPAGIIGKTSYRGYVGRYSFYIEDNNLHAFFQPDVNYSVTTPIAPYLDNKFHNLVMTIDRTSMMYFYIDGVSVGTPLNVSGVSSINLNSSTDNFYIGSYGSSNGQSPQYFLNGNVSQASIYSRALTAAEVLQNYNALRPRFGDVTNPTTGKTWMDRNLGATNVATSSTDANSYGDLYQWGRAADGHQIRTSSTTSTFSSTDLPGNANFILGPNPPYDWRSTANSNLWQGVNGVNNPCPSGYRLPTQAEWDAERLSWSSQNAAGAFASPLKLPMAGRRDGSDGSITQVGTYGWYWSSTTAYQGACNCNISKRLYFFNTGFNNTDDNGRSNAFAVRCIKE